MNNQLINLIKKNNIKSIIKCIIFFNEIGYTLEEIYKLSCELFDSKIQIDTKGLTDKELSFVECINGCEIIIDKINYSDSIFYKKNGEVFFEQELKNGHFWCSDKNCWSIFETKYYWNYEQVQAFIKDLLERHLELSGVIPWKGVVRVDNELLWKNILDY